MRVGLVVVAGLLVGLGFAGLGGAARAQSAVDGAVAGRVVSAEGEAIEGAEIELVGEQGERSRTLSGKHGEFQLVRLTPGEYRLVAHAPGYRGTVEQGVTVELGRTTELELGHAVVARSTVPKDKHISGIHLSPLPYASKAGIGRRGMRVVDAAPSALRLDPDATVIGVGELGGSPVAGKEWASLAAESPGVVADPDADGQVLLSVRGLAATENATQVDGVSHNQSFGSVPTGTGGEDGRDAEDDAVEGTSSGRTSGGASGYGIGMGRHAGAAYTFSQAAVREFRVAGQGYTAVYGGAAGAVSTVVSKSGTDEVHGSGFFLLREAAWAAANSFSIRTTYADGVVASSVVKPPDRREQLGGTLGGPLWRDKLFYFGAYDRQTRDFPAVSSPEYPGFYSLTAMQTALLGTRGVSKTKVNAALNYLASLTGTVPRRHDQTVAFAKLDARLPWNNHVSVQGNRAVWSGPGAATTAPVVARGMASIGNSEGSVEEGVLRWTAFLGSKLSNEARLGYGRDFQYETAQAPLPQEPAISVGGYAPEVNIGPEGLLFGTPASLGRKAYPDERRLQFAETLGWTRGRHFMRVGGEMSMIHDRIDALANQEGTFHYDSGVTGGKAGGLVDWITDFTYGVNAYPNGACPSIFAKVHDACFRSYSQSFGTAATTFDTTEMAGFVQEEWRPGKGLTINLGARWEIQGLPAPQHPNAALDAVFAGIGKTSVFPADGNNYGPRLGISWVPFGFRGWVIHAGFGLYFGRLPGTTIRAALEDTAMASSTLHVRITPATETLCPQASGGPNQGFGYPCAYVATPPAAVTTTTSALIFDKRFQLPTVQQGSFSVEHEMGGGVTAGVSYRFNSDRQLPNAVDVNIAPSPARELFQLSGGTGKIGVKDGEQFLLPMYTSRATTLFGPVTDLVSNSNATYNALVVEGRRRGRGGLEFRGSWTWSKAIDYGQIEGTPRTNAQLDPFKLGYDRGLSNLNYPHRIVLSVVWAPRVRTESRTVRAVLNGWEAGPIFSEQSGRPYSLAIYGGTLLKGGHYSINGSGGATYLPTVGRNTERLPDAMNVNLRLARAIRLTERVRVRGTAEAFNLANRTNYSGVQTRAFLAGTKANGVTPLVFQNATTVSAEGLNVRPFGTFTAAGTSALRERQVQLGLRLDF